MPHLHLLDHCLESSFWNACADDRVLWYQLVRWYPTVDVMWILNQLCSTTVSDRIGSALEFWFWRLGISCSGSLLLSLSFFLYFFYVECASAIPGGLSVAISLDFLSAHRTLFYRMCILATWNNLLQPFLQVLGNFILC